MSEHNCEHIYGVVAEFDDETGLLAACHKVRDAGYTHIEAYAPYPVEGLNKALGRKRSILPYLIFGGGLTGASVGYGMQWYAMAHGYPLNIGGRPLHSWPSFIPVTFELTVLFAALTAIFAMILLNRLPQLHHPIFETPNFERASQDRFFLCIEARDKIFEPTPARELLSTCEPLSVTEVPLK